MYVVSGYVRRVPGPVPNVMSLSLVFLPSRASRPAEKRARRRRAGTPTRVNHQGAGRRRGRRRSSGRCVVESSLGASRCLVLQMWHQHPARCVRVHLRGRRWAGGKRADGGRKHRNVHRNNNIGRNHSLFRSDDQHICFLHYELHSKMHLCQILLAVRRTELPSCSLVA